MRASMSDHEAPIGLGAKVGGFNNGLVIFGLRLLQVLVQSDGYLCVANYGFSTEMSNSPQTPFFLPSWVDAHGRETENALSLVRT
jgi:hypothetical protein